MLGLRAYQAADQTNWYDQENSIDDAHYVVCNG